MCIPPLVQSVLSGGHLNKRRGRENRTFYTMQRFHSEYNKHALLQIQTNFTVVGLVT
ncbi:unnamed protein product, partial [Staurois parvus]